MAVIQRCHQILTPEASGSVKECRTGEVFSEDLENLYTSLDVLLVDVTLCDKLKECLLSYLGKVYDFRSPHTLHIERKGGQYILISIYTYLSGWFSWTIYIVSEILLCMVWAQLSFICP